MILYYIYRGSKFEFNSVSSCRDANIQWPKFEFDIQHFSVLKYILVSNKKKITLATWLL
jgi:hypothetical protein